MNDAIHIVEEKTAKVKEQLRSTTSSKRSLIILFEYYQFLLDINNKQITETYLPEFLQDYSDLIENFNPYCLHPSITQQIIKQAKKIADHFSGTEVVDSILIGAKKLQGELNKLKRVLTGDILEELVINKLCFPLIEENNGESPSVSTGILETLTIKISKAKNENKFLLIPSEVKIESRLKEQIETSWQKAVEVVKRYAKKITSHHEVIIRFDKRVGFYRGNSLGAALTLTFIEELLNYYNSPVVIKIGKSIALTGGLNEEGSLIATSKEVIEKKVENVFYSPIQTFVVPEEDLPFGEEKLKTLKQEFPQRKLNLIGIKTFDDLLDSRKLVDIRKQKIFVRSSKFAKKNWVAIILLVALTSLIYLGRFYDFDTNPAVLKNEKDWLFVQNKNGKLLWEKRMGYDITNWYYSSYPKATQKLVDINNDGENEILLTAEYRIRKDTTYSVGRVVCYSSSGSLIWDYFFRDSISSNELDHSLEYHSRVIDTITIENKRAVALFSRNNLYPSAVYFLRLADGQRLGPTLWQVGHLQSGLICDLNKDGNLELIMVGINNALGRSVLFSIDIDNITDAQLPAEGTRLFKNLKFASVNKYILLPQTDYDKYYGNKFNFAMVGNLNIRKNSNEVFIYLFEGPYNNKKAIFLQFDKNLSVSLIDASENFEVARDSLVAKGELFRPYTHTPEFINLLWNQLSYWDGEKFTRR